MSDSIVAKHGPCSVALKVGRTYFWCACGRSQGQPFCDGSHKGTSITPLMYTAEKSGQVWFCGCKATSKSPLCDGTHNRL